MKKIFGLLLVALMALSANAANVEDWNLYLAYHNALGNQPVGDEIYANFDGNLLAYHPEDGEVRFFSKLDGLNGRNIRLMGYSATEKCLLLVYDNFQIDLLYPEDGSVMSLPQIKNSGIDGLQVHQLFIDGAHAVLAMSNGLVHLNLERQEISGYYILDKDIQAAACYRGVLYAAGNDELYACPLEGNPLDKNEWKAIEKVAFRQFVACGGLYGVAEKTLEGGLNSGLWLLQEEGLSFEQISKEVFPNLYVGDNKLVASNSSAIQVFDGVQPGVSELDLSCDNQWNALSRTSDGLFWASDGLHGMQAYKVDGNTLVPQGDPVGNYGPRRDLCYYMRYVGNRLLIAGGRLDPYDRQHYPGTIMELTEGKWKFFQEDSIASQTGVPFRDITSLAVDPSNPDKIMASSGGTGLYEFVDYKFTKHFSIDNSPLQSAVTGNPRYVRLDGLNYDAKGNLWMVNTVSEDTLLRVLRPDGTWNAIFEEGIKGAPTCEKTLIDQKGRLWVASRRTVGNPRHDAGLLCLDYNGTVTNVGDDVSTYRTTFVNQDGKSYLIEGVYCMAEDKDGAIWVGTKAGLFVIANPDDWHKSDFYVIQVKVPRNDGTNLADYLLSGIPISAIAIDGAGRKWVGTETNGLYLVSADGTKVLDHFEEQNTPLLSNYIYSIAPNMVTGEVMIGTDKGLCSYQGGATIPEESLNENSVKVYPNPVRPNYYGPVKVTGLTDNAEVKVMTASGEVIAVGQSTGGTFVWNVKDGGGSRVAPGIYYFMIATSDGKKGVAAKIVVI